MGANVSRSRDNTPRNSEVASPEPPAPASAPKKAKKDRKKEAREAKIAGFEAFAFR